MYRRLTLNPKSSKSNLLGNECSSEQETFINMITLNPIAINSLESKYSIL